jgi:hypothetical protein
MARAPSARDSLAAMRELQMSVAFQGWQENWQQRPQALDADSIGSLPEHDQRCARRPIVQRGSNTGPDIVGEWHRRVLRALCVILVCMGPSKMAESYMVTRTLAGNISREATTPPGNIFHEAMRPLYFMLVQIQ